MPRRYAGYPRRPNHRYKPPGRPGRPRLEPHLRKKRPGNPISNMITTFVLLVLVTITKGIMDLSDMIGNHLNPSHNQSNIERID